METTSEILQRIHKINANNGINDRGFKDGGDSISVHKILGTLFAPFDADAISQRLYSKYHNDQNSTYYGKTAEDIKDMWKQSGARSIGIGQRVGDTISYFFSLLKDTTTPIDEQRRILDKAIRRIDVNEFNEAWMPEWKGYYRGCMNSFFEYLRSLNGTDWELIGTEVPMYDPINNILGRADCILRQGEHLVLIEWKTDQEISTMNKFQKMLGPMRGYQDTKLNKYTMQVYLYIWMMQNVYQIDSPIEAIIVKLNATPEGDTIEEPTIFEPNIPYESEDMDDVIEYAITQISSEN